MVTPKLGKLLEIAGEAVRATQAGADLLRGEGLLAQAAYLETAATSLAAARHDVVTSEDIAKLLSIAGHSVRAMQGVADILRETGLSAVALEAAAGKLAKALHDASQDTVPIAVSDVLGTEDTWDESD